MMTRRHRAPIGRRLPAVALALVLVSATAASVVFAAHHSAKPSSQPASPAAASPASSSDRMAQLWEEPSPIETLDLYYGPGGKDIVPDPDATYQFEKLDSTGHSKGYEMKD